MGPMHRNRSTGPSASLRPSLPANRRTVLLAVHDKWENEPHKLGILEHARQQGWHLLDLRYYNMNLPRTFHPDGAIFYLADEEAPLVRRLVRARIPVVQIQDYHLPGKVCCVVQDRQAIGEAAAEHFAARGFQNLAYLHGEIWGESPNTQIGEAFINAARGLGARAEPIAVQHPGSSVSWDRFDTLAGRFGKEISRLQLPLGIFTYSDIMATRICHFCQAVGLRVPEQVAVLGAGNDLTRCECSSVPLSSVDPNFIAQGLAAAELLTRLMDGKPAPAEPVLTAPAGIVTRQSTNILALPDLDTARALRYMWDHLHEPLKVPDIADAVGVSRRKLERHFRTYLHRSVNEEFVRKRIERCCELLTSTSDTVEAVARRAGFSTEKYFFRVFRKATGTTPRKYRVAQISKRNQAGQAESGTGG